ncbi:MAG: hypothetical protein KDB01_04110, partial [Planctomycetaceae bacterium]|nr:hypothetical protein [Planctomycetaceae bacterium]
VVVLTNDPLLAGHIQTAQNLLQVVGVVSFAECVNVAVTLRRDEPSGTNIAIGRPLPHESIWHRTIVLESAEG